MNNNVYKNSISKFLKSKDFKISNERPNLNVFTTISKGDAYKIKSCWKSNNNSNSTYVISYYNSYKLHVVSADLEYLPKLVTSEYLCCFVSLAVPIVETIIHPLNFEDKILNIIFHENIKIKYNDKFNTKYVLRSVDKDAILNVLTKSFIDSMVLYDDLYIEIKDNNALIYYLRPIQEDDGLTLTEIAEKITNFPYQYNLNIIDTFFYQQKTPANARAFLNYRWNHLPKSVQSNTILLPDDLRLPSL